MKILGICGSLRNGSYNMFLLQNAAAIIRKEGAEFESFDLSEIPLYNADLDGDSKPQPVKKFIEAIANSNGLMLATPEYNYSIPGVLKNAIDWASRPGFQSVLKNKPAGIVSASMSAVGGARAQVHLRNVLASTLSPVFLNPDYLLPSAQNAFDEHGELQDSTARDRLQRYIQHYVEWLAKLQDS